MKYELVSAAGGWLVLLPVMFDSFLVSVIYFFAE